MVWKFTFVCTWALIWMFLKSKQQRGPSTLHSTGFPVGIRDSERIWLVLLARGRQVTASRDCHIPVFCAALPSAALLAISWGLIVVTTHSSLCGTKTHQNLPGRCCLNVTDSAQYLPTNPLEPEKLLCFRSSQTTGRFHLVCVWGSCCDSQKGAGFSSLLSCVTQGGPIKA